MNGDLISRSEAEKKIRAYADEVGCGRGEYELANGILKAACLIGSRENMPAAYNADKVVEQLEEQKNQYFRRAEEIKNKFGENYESQKNYGKACSYDHAIEIVKSGGIE